MNESNKMISFIMIVVGAIMVWIGLSKVIDLGSLDLINIIEKNDISLLKGLYKNEHSMWALMSIGAAMSFMGLSLYANSRTLTHYYDHNYRTIRIYK